MHRADPKTRQAFVPASNDQRAVPESGPAPRDPARPAATAERVDLGAMFAPTARSSPPLAAELALEALQPGERIGPYEVIRPLGSGGMGVVYLARDRKLGRRVAIKLLRTEQPRLTRRFITEAQATARCTHENIVVIHEVGEHRGCPYMVLEYLDGRTFTQFRDTRQPIGRTVEVMAAVVRALVRAHAQGIVHRDLKPDNVFLTDSGSVKVLDFGIAKLKQSEAELDLRARLSASVPGETSTIAGTLAYMSPEQWGVGGEIDHRTDIWSVGLMLFEFLAGRHPLDEHPSPALWVTDLSQPFPDLHTQAPDVPHSLANVVDTCLRKRKEERYADAAALLRALEPFLPGHFSQPPLQIEVGPYAGLRAFQEEDAARFFGRDQEIAAMALRLRETPLLGVVGPSGSGKSSLLRAGVVPALKRSGEAWSVLVVRPGRDPMSALARALTPWLDSEAAAAEPSGLQNALRGKLLEEPGYFGSVLRHAAHRSHQRLLVLVDQFEELYTLEAPLSARKGFTACLSGAADDATSPLRVVLSIRADFLGRIAEDPRFMSELGKALFFVGPPTPKGLHEALVQPAEHAGYRFESPAMVEEMVDYLHETPAGLPVLQFAAAQLWETRDASRHLLTESAYRGLGGVAGALVSHADGVMAKLTPEQHTLCRALFVQLVTPERTRAVRSLPEVKELVGGGATLDALLDELVSSRLLVARVADGTAVVELVHESLITTWPMLRRWLDQTQEDGAFLSQLLNAAHQWHKKQRVNGLLWGSDMVAELQRFERRYDGTLPELARVFSSAVVAHAERGARLRRALVSAAVGLSVMLLMAAGVALVVIRRAQMTAEANARAATAAKTEAQTRLGERMRAEQKQQALSQRMQTLLRDLKRANVELQERSDQLERGKRELLSALSETVQSRESAQRNRLTAERAAREARDQRLLAEYNARETQRLLEKELERTQRMNRELGTLIEELR